MDIKSYIKKEIIEIPNTVQLNPIVSVCVVTFNHVRFIEQCLNGILSQETNFPFEVLVGDDESSDGTREICIRYAENYPEKIRLFLHHRDNVIHINGRPTGRFNFAYNLINARGKYIAICEGDDYWTNEYKLQKQVDFLEQNKEYGMVHSDYDSLIDKSQKINRSINGRKKLDVLSGSLFEEFLRKDVIIRTVTVCAVKKLVVACFEEYSQLLSSWRMADLPMWLEISQKSKIGYINESLATHRLLETSASHYFKNRSRGLEFHESVYNVKYFFIEKYKCSPATLRKVNINYNTGLLTYAFYLNDHKKAKLAYDNIKLLSKSKLAMPRWKFLFFYLGTKNKLSRFFVRGIIFIKHKFQKVPFQRIT